jgi:hypothetical protein
LSFSFLLLLFFFFFLHLEKDIEHGVLKIEDVSQKVETNVKHEYNKVRIRG